MPMVQVGLCSGLSDAVARTTARRRWFLWRAGAMGPLVVRRDRSTGIRHPDAAPWPRLNQPQRAISMIIRPPPRPARTRDEPRISLNKLAQYVDLPGGSAGRRREILQDSKFPPDFKGGRYNDARRTLSNCSSTAAIRSDWSRSRRVFAGTAPGRTGPSMTATGRPRRSRGSSRSSSTRSTRRSLGLAGCGVLDWRGDRYPSARSP
jgi:hypothetical protein